MITMGIDLGIHKIAWSIWDEDILISTGAWTATRSLRHEQLTELGAIMSSQIATHEPDQIFLEDVLIGNNRKYSIQLAETKGAILSAIGLATQIHTMIGRVIPVIPVNVSTWKKEVLGNGKASKDDISSYIYDLDSAYAVLCGSDQDRYDAAAIGYYGYIISGRAESLAKSGFSPS